MVAVVHHSKTLRGCVNYNEKKVQAGLARCLEAGYYPMDAADMNFHQKLRRLIPTLCKPGNDNRDP